MMTHYERSIRDEVLEAIDNDIINKDDLIISMLKYMRTCEVEDMLNVSKIFLDGPVDTNNEL